MTEAELSLFLDSFERCMQNQCFIKAFYDVFLNASEEIPAFFTHTDFSKQRRILKSSLYDMVTASARRTVDCSMLSKLTERHRELKVQPHHYDLWLQSLIKAVAECDPLFTAEVGEIWREAFQAGIAYMKMHA